jgi:hypothetical protein
MFFSLTFSTVSASHYTPFVYVAILSTPRDAVPKCRNKRKIVYRESQITVHLRNSGAALC